MSALKIPADFTRHVTADFGPEGAEWLAGLPDLAAAYARKWDLRFEGEARHGYVAVVQPVRRADGTRAVLKLTWQDEETLDEPLALSTWDGQGAVLLLDNAPEDGVLLLERLDATRMLDAEPPAYAVEIAGGLARRLAVPAPPELSRDLRTEAANLVEELPRTWRKLGEPFPRRLVDAAVSVCRELGPSAARLLVNEDLHYENVLAGTREPWLVIDPKPLVGDLEYGVIPLLWNRFSESTLDDRFATAVSSAGLDAGKALAWTLVRAVQNWLWLLGDEDSPIAAVPEIARWAVTGGSKGPLVSF